MTVHEKKGKMTTLAGDPGPRSVAPGAGRMEGVALAADNPVPKNLPLLLVLYLLGIFMGAIDTGIVTPARTLIQSALGVDGKTGIWIITIYTLAYAAIIPISGKLADRFGRKIIYIASIALFGAGSAICALSASSGSFAVMLLGRVVQAIGGGGIMPIATAEFGTTFPEAKRGMALGLVGGVYGIANILGSTMGSAILDIFGKSRWDILFMVNVPIAALIVVAGIFILPNTKGTVVRKIDWAGIPVLSAMVLALLYGLRNIDFFNFATSIRSVQVYPFLVAFAALLPILIYIEKKAQDPVLTLSYFTNRQTLVTLILSFIVGVMMMGMVFVPQFAENALRIASGSGGYFVAVLGIFAGLSGPASGSLIDKFGPKKILYAGFAITLGGALFLILYTVPNPSTAAVIVSLAIMGLGLGFTMGTPLNYMMLQNTRKENSNSALATLSLIRSIGTAIAPAIMIGFLAHAGMSAQDKLMAMMPPVQAPRIENAEKLSAMIEKMKADPRSASMLQGMTIPSFDATAGMGSITDMAKAGSAAGGSGSPGMPADLVAKLQGADVTTIVDTMKELAVRMFDAKTPAVIDTIRAGIGTGLAKMEEAAASMDRSLAGVKSGSAGMAEAIAKMDAGLRGIDMAIAGARAPAQTAALKGQREGLAKARDELAAKAAGMAGASAGIAAGRASLGEVIATTKALDAEIPVAFGKSRDSYLADIEARRPEIEKAFQTTLNIGFSQMYITVAVASVLGALVLAIYRQRKKPQATAKSAATAA